MKIEQLPGKLRRICVTGFSTFFIDVAMGILTVLFHRQIMKYLGANALAVYDPIIQVSPFVQCCAYSVGQASRPIISMNFGAERGARIRQTLLPFNIFSTYYFQAIMKPQAAFVVSVARGLVISGVLILLLPLLIGAGSLWLAIPITELLVMFYAAAAIRSYTRALPDGVQT